MLLIITGTGDGLF